MKTNATNTITNNCKYIIRELTQSLEYYFQSAYQRKFIIMIKLSRLIYAFKLKFNNYIPLI